MSGRQEGGLRSLKNLSWNVEHGLQRGIVIKLLFGETNRNAYKNRVYARLACRGGKPS